MQRYILGRVLQALLSLLVLSTVVFFIVRLTGNPLDLLLGEGATLEDRRAVAQELGLDRPLVVQFGHFLTNAVRGDFGRSLRARRPAAELVLERLPATLQLGALGALMSVFIAIPLGAYAAYKRGTWLDNLAQGVGVLGQSVPTFWLGLILIWVFAVGLGWLPSAGRSGFTSFLMPAFTLGWFVVAGILRLTRSSMIEVLGSEYIKMARIKGVSEMGVVWKHALKNAALPVLTFSVMYFVVMLTGAVVTEVVFAWPGVGRLVIDAVRWRDFPVVQTVVLWSGAMYIFANLLVDVAYAYLNPKIRYQR